MLEFLEKARTGEMIPSDVIVQYAHYFQDDLTLDNMPRMQLINMSKYMGIPPYGGDPFLRFQLRHRIRTLKEDDQRILWEGIDSLTKIPSTCSNSPDLGLVNPGSNETRVKPRPFR